jgi:hypothetical protein
VGKFFYNVMMSDTRFHAVFQEQQYLLFAENLSLSLNDTETMYPYERSAYVDFLHEINKKREEEMKKSESEHKSASMSTPRMPSFRG